MTIKQKIEIIQKILKLNQTQLAEKLGVSFATFNSWWNEKSIPRLKKIAIIDDLYLEVTGEKKIPDDFLVAKKQLLQKRSLKYKNIIKFILSNPDIRDELVLKLTYHSNSIEGSTLTESDTSAILFNDVALPNKSMIEHLEAKNHQFALLYLLDYVSSNKKIDENFILKIHSILMNGIFRDAGEYRKHGVRIVGANLPTANYLSVPKLIKAVVKEINKKNNDIVCLITFVHSDFEKIHPFSDGNGRVGRLLMTAMLLKNGLAPAIIEQERKQLYYIFLNKAQTKNDQTLLEDYICDAIFDGFDILERKS